MVYILPLTLFKYAPVGLKGIEFHCNTNTLTRKLPKAELKIAAASLPPTALVRMTAEDTGGGIQPTTCNLQVT